jgi:hypothetical protein
MPASLDLDETEHAALVALLRETNRKQAIPVFAPRTTTWRGPPLVIAD